MSIMTSPYKHPQTGVYYFRMAVPKALVPIIGKTVFKTSLRTKKLREAKLSRLKLKMILLVITALMHLFTLQFLYHLLKFKLRKL
ncbi:DUF6538 domain-containing protein [Vibrio sp. J1-1]|uniref:DUF6538 domain-containing protein n=1 Tax=Vibrio sp. J1-1 TaxID=2912251 RepID=UPI0031F8915C